MSNFWWKRMTILGSSWLYWGTWLELYILRPFCNSKGGQWYWVTSDFNLEMVTYMLMITTGKKKWHIGQTFQKTEVKRSKIRGRGEKSSVSPEMVTRNSNVWANTNKNGQTLATRLDKKVKFSYRFLYTRQIFTKRKLLKPHELQTKLSLWENTLLEIKRVPS